MSEPALPSGFDGVLAEAAPLAAVFHDAGFRLYLVGGVVRDHLMGIQHAGQDLDATTDARPEEIKRLVAGLAEAVWTQGERFGTIGCRIDGRPYEITTHRADAYDESSRKPVVSFGDHIEDDLARRDFTVNAMAVDLRDRRLVDPHDGRGDLERLILRTPLDPEVSFSDDPLRMLRAARFHATYGLVPVEPLTSAIAEMGDRMAIVSAERVRDELEKLLLLDRAGEGLRLLHSTRLLGRVIEALDGIAAGEVELLGRRVEAQAVLAGPRWAALLFDARPVAASLGPLRPSGHLAREVTWLVGDRTWLDSVPHDPPAIRRAASASPVGHVIENRLDFFAALRMGDEASGDDIAAARETTAALRTAEPDLDNPRPVLSGDVVCGLLDLSPGPDVGVALGWLAEQRIIEGPLDPDDAKERLLEWWKSRPLR